MFLRDKSRRLLSSKIFKSSEIQSVLIDLGQKANTTESQLKDSFSFAGVNSYNFVKQNSSLKSKKPTRYVLVDILKDNKNSLEKAFFHLQSQGVPINQ